jgi:hypothetical protein
VSRSTRVLKRAQEEEEAARLEVEVEQLSRERFSANRRLSWLQRGKPRNYSYSESTYSIGGGGEWFTLRGKLRVLNRRKRQLQLDIDLAHRRADLLEIA